MKRKFVKGHLRYLDKIKKRQFFYKVRLLPDLPQQIKSDIKYGIKNIGYWTSEVGEYSDRLTYIVAFEDQGHREKAWNAFRNDPEWNKVRTESELEGPIVKRVFNNLLTPTDYSPLQ